MSFVGSPTLEVTVHEVVHALRAGHPAAAGHGDRAGEEQVARRISAAVTAGCPHGPLAAELDRPRMVGTFAFQGDLPAEIGQDFADDVRGALAEARDVTELRESLDGAVAEEADDPDRTAALQGAVDAVVDRRIVLGEEHRTLYVLEVTPRSYTPADRAGATVKQAQVLKHLDQLTQWEGAPNPAAYVYTMMTDAPMDDALAAYLEQVWATIERAAPGKSVIVVHRRIEP